MCPVVDGVQLTAKVSICDHLTYSREEYRNCPLSAADVARQTTIYLIRINSIPCVKQLVDEVQICVNLWLQTTRCRGR